MGNLKRNILFGTGALIGSFIATGLVVGHTFRSKKYEIEVEGLKEEVKIVSISDFHNLNLELTRKSLIRKVKKAKPDLILLAGDINVSKNVLQYFDLLSSLRDIASVYYVRGNHDNDNGEYKKFLLELDILEITDLNDKSLVLNIKGNRFNLIGLSDVFSSKLFKQDEAVVDKVLDNYMTFNNHYKEEMINIVLTHRPNYLENLLGYHSVIGFAGHTHGGQFRLPLSQRGLIVPDQGVMGKYGYGAFRGNDSLMIVSSGAGNYYMPRFYNPKEIVVVSLTGEIDE